MKTFDHKKISYDASMLARRTRGNSGIVSPIENLRQMSNYFVIFHNKHSYCYLFEVIK